MNNKSVTRKFNKNNAHTDNINKETAMACCEAVFGENTGLLGELIAMFDEEKLMN